MNREQPAKQAAFQAVVMGSTPIRFTSQCPCGEIADTLRLERGDFGHAGAIPARGTNLAG